MYYSGFDIVFGGRFLYLIRKTELNNLMREKNNIWEKAWESRMKVSLITGVSKRPWPIRYNAGTKRTEKRGWNHH